MTSTIGPKEERLAIIPVLIIGPTRKAVNEIYSSAHAVTGFSPGFSAVFFSSAFQACSVEPCFASHVTTALAVAIAR
jgi:hypothetical protein